MGIHPGRAIAGMTLEQACRLALHIAEGNQYHVVQIVDMGSYRNRGQPGWLDLVLRYRIAVEDKETRQRFYVESESVWTPIEQVMSPEY